MILEAAGLLFASGGFAGMTTAAVAREAKVAEPILYRHFPSKRAILHHLLEEVVTKVTRVLKGLVQESGDSLAALTAFCRRYPEIARAHEREFRVINRALAELEDERSRELLRGHYETYHREVSGLIEDCQRRGSLRRDISASVGAWHLINAALGFLFTKGLESSSQKATDYEAGLATAALAGLMRTQEVSG